MFDPYATTVGRSSNFLKEEEEQEEDNDDDDPDEYTLKTINLLAEGGFDPSL